MQVDFREDEYGPYEEFGRTYQTLDDSPRWKADETEVDSRPGVYEVSFSLHLVAGCLKNARYSMALYILNKSRKHFSTRMKSDNVYSLEAAVTLAFEGLSAYADLPTLTKEEITDLVECALDADDLYRGIEELQPRIAARVYKDMDLRKNLANLARSYSGHDPLFGYSLLDDRHKDIMKDIVFDVFAHRELPAETKTEFIQVLEQDTPMLMAEVYKELDLKHNLVRLARLYEDSDPIFGLELLGSHLEGVRLAMIERMLSEKWIDKDMQERQRIYDKDTYDAMIRSIGQADPDERTYDHKRRLLKKIAQDAREKSPWSAYHAAKLLRSSNVLLYRDMRANLVSRQGLAQADRILDEFVQVDKILDRQGVLQLADKHKKFGLKTDNAEWLHFSLRLYRMAGLTKNEEGVLHNLLFEMCNRRMLPEMSYQETVAVVKMELKKDYPLGAKRLLDSLERTDEVRSLYHRLAVGLAYANRPGLALEAEVEALDGVKDPDLCCLYALLRHYSEKHPVVPRDKHGFPLDRSDLQKTRTVHKIESEPFDPEVDGPLDRFGYPIGFFDDYGGEKPKASHDMDCKVPIFEKDIEG